MPLVRFGVLILPEERWSVARERWRAAEELGFDHAWTYDHLTWRTFRDKTWFGAVPTLAAAAEATSRIRLGTLVASPNFRHPVPFAKELMTLDDVSRGRFTVGIGAGSDSFDALALGHPSWPRGERTERFEEFVALLDRLLRSPATTHEGRYYSANEARSIPGCVQQPRLPFAVAGEGPRGMRVAARYGETWVTIDGRETGREQVHRLDDICAEAGREPASLQRLALLGFRERPLASVDAFRDVLGRHAELGFTDLVVHWPRRDEPFRDDRAVLDQIAADVLGKR